MSDFWPQNLIFRPDFSDFLNFELGALIDLDSGEVSSSKASNATSELEFPPLIHTSNASDQQPINKLVEFPLVRFK